MDKYINLCLLFMLLIAICVPLRVSILASNPNSNIPRNEEVSKHRHYLGTKANNIIELSEQSYISDKRNVDSNRYVRIHYEFRPQSLRVIKGKLVSGNILGTHRSDGRKMVFQAENSSGHYEIVLIADFQLMDSGQVVLSCQGTDITTIYIYVYDANLEAFVELSEHALNSSFEGPIYNFSQGTLRLKMKLRFNSSKTFNITLYHLIAVTFSKNLKLYCDLMPPSRMRYKLITDNVCAGTKIVFENLTKFMRLQGEIGPPCSWNFSEHSIYIYGDGSLEIIFSGYDIWNYENNLELHINFYSGEEKLNISDLNASYKITYIKVTSLDMNSPIYENYIELLNTNPYDLYDVPVKIIINNSWINLLSTNANLSDLSFYTTYENQTMQLKNYLSRWNGTAAIFYLKLPRIRAMANIPVYIRYGGAPIDKHNDSVACCFGNAFSELSNSSMWIIPEGSFSARYDAENDLVRICLYDTTEPVYSKAIFTRYISGRTEGAINVVSTLENNDYWLIDYYIVYVDSGNFVKLSIRNDVQIGLTEIKVVQRRQGVDKVLSVNYESFNYPLDHGFSFEISPLTSKLKIDLHFWYDNYSRSITTDVDSDLLRFGWNLAFSSKNLTVLDLAITSWNQEVEQPILISKISDVRMICNTTYQLASTSWRKLNESVISVPPLSILGVRLFDAFGRSVCLYYENISRLNTSVLNITLNASLLLIENLDYTEKTVYVSTINKSLIFRIKPSTRKIFVVHYGFYAIKFGDEIYRIYGSNISLIIFEAYRPGIILLNISSAKDLLRGILTSGARPIGYIEKRDLDILSENLNVFMFCITNYSEFAKLALYLIDSIQCVFNRTIFSVSPTYEFNNLSRILMGLIGYVELHGNVSLLEIDLSKKQISYVDSSGFKVTQLNMTKEDIISKLQQISEAFRYSIWALSLFADNPKDMITRIQFNSTSRTIDISGMVGSLNIAIDYTWEQIHIVEPWSLVGSFMKLLICCLDYAQMIGGQIPVTSNVSILDRIFLEITINRKTMNIFLKTADTYLEKLDVDFSTQIISVFKPSVGGITTSYKASDGSLIVCGRLIATEQRVFLMVRDCQFNSQKYLSVKNKLGILEKYEAIIDKRHIELIDYYSFDLVPNGFVAMTINNTITIDRSEIDIWTISKTILLIEVEDLMGNLLGNISSEESIVRLYVKLGSIVIMNDLSDEISAKIISEETANSLELFITGKSSQSILVKVNVVYNVQIMKDNSTILNTTVFLSNIDKTRPTYLVLIGIQSQENPTTTNSSNSGLPQNTNESMHRDHIAGIINRYLPIAISAIAIIVATTIIRRILNKLRRKRVISAEELIESLIRGGVSTDVFGQQNENRS